MLVPKKRRWDTYLDPFQPKEAELQMPYGHIRQIQSGLLHRGGHMQGETPFQLRRSWWRSTTHIERGERNISHIYWFHSARKTWAEPASSSLNEGTSRGPQILTHLTCCTLFDWQNGIGI